MNDFQNFLRKKRHEEDIDEMDEIYRKKRKMNENDIEELIGVTVSAAAALCQIKERKERTKSKVRYNSWRIEEFNS